MQEINMECPNCEKELIPKFIIIDGKKALIFKCSGCRESYCEEEIW